MSAHGPALRLKTQRDVIEALDRLPAPAFVFEVDSGRFLASNSAFEMLLGYTKAELLAMNVEAIQPAAHVANCHEARKQAPPQGLLRWQYCCKDGSVLNVRVHYREVAYRPDSGSDLNGRFVVVEFWEKMVE
jgi:PAS domain S-box-containing protein